MKRRCAQLFSRLRLSMSLMFTATGIMFGTIIIAIAVPSSPAGSAEDCEAPCIGYAISAEVENDWIFSADPSSNRSNDLGPTLDSLFYFSPIEHLKFVTSVTTEQVLDKEPGANRAFGDIGTYIEKLYVEYETDPFLVRVGKINPVFGLATDELDGIYATDLADNYDTDERWGAEAAINYEALGLYQSVTANVFTTDRTVLSESLFSNRGRGSLATGGAGNAEGPASFGIFLDGCRVAETSECYADGKFGYRLGFRYQKAGHQTEDQREDGVKPKDELAYLAAGTWRLKFDENIIRLLGEVAYLENFDGEPTDALVTTASAALEAKSMTYMATYTRQENFLAGASDTSETLIDVTAMYTFSEEAGPGGGTWSLGPAYSYSRTADEGIAHKLGLILTLDLESEGKGGD